MQKEQLQDLLFFKNSKKDIRILERFLEVLASTDATYFVDLDGTITNSPEHITNLLNQDFESNRIKRKYRARDLNRPDAIRTWSLENGLPADKANAAEHRWYENGPLLASRPYWLAIPLMKKIMKHVGVDRLKILTAREPHLVDSTMRWHQRWIPFVKKENILIRKPEDMISHGTFKVLSVFEEAKKSKYVVVLEDSGSNIEEILRYCDEKGAFNVYCIHLPLGQTKPALRHERVLTLRREPVETQDIESLYEVVMAAISSSVAQ